MKKLQDMSKQERDKRVARLVKNPATRAAVATKFLPANLRAERDKNTRLAQPVVPGSSVTQRDLGHQTQAASALKYGQAETDLGRGVAASQQQQKDTAGWYQQYLNELRAHEANTASIGNQAQQANQGLVNAVGAPQLAAAPPGASAENTQDAAAASMIRQALSGSFGAMMAAQTGGANQQADTLSHVVGPGQQLQGLASAAGKVTQARQKQSDLAKEKGAFEQQFENEFKTNESKNVLAGQIAGVKATQEDKKIKIAQTLAEGTTAAKKATTAKTKADTKKTNAEIDFFNKHGYYPGTSKPKAATGYKAGGPGLNKYGFTYDQWTGMTPKARQDARAGKGKKPKDVLPSTQYDRNFYSKYGVKPATTAALNSATSTIGQATTWLNKLGGATGANGQTLTTGQPAGKNDDGSPRPAVPKLPALFVRVAMDINQYGGITPGTADRLHHAGYSVAKLRLKNAPKLPTSGAGTGGDFPATRRN